MIINFTPIVTHREENDYYLYHTEGDILYVTKGDITEEFDFTDFPNGVAQDIVSDHFDTSPVIEAKKVDGILYVTVGRTLPETVSEELAFPEPIDTSEYDLSDYEKDPLYIYLEERYSDNEVPDTEEPNEPEYTQEGELPEESSDTEEEEELGEPEVIKLTEHEYSKEENIDYTPIVDEVIVEHELEPVPDIEAPEPIEPDDDLLKTPEFTDIESALEQAFLEEEERKLQEELARQKELEEKLMEEQMAEMDTEFNEQPPLNEPVDEVPTIDDYSEEEPSEPKQSDETLPSEVLEVDEYDYTSNEETALEDNTEENSEVGNNG